MFDRVHHILTTDCNLLQYKDEQTCNELFFLSLMDDTQFAKTFSSTKWTNYPYNFLQ